MKTTQFTVSRVTKVHHPGVASDVARNMTLQRGGTRFIMTIGSIQSSMVAHKWSTEMGRRDYGVGLEISIDT